MGKYGKACWFRGCPSRSLKHPTLKFFPFIKPWSDLERCLSWIAASGRTEPKEYINKNCYVCEKHFLNGSPSAESPDPLPLPFQYLDNYHYPRQNYPDPGEPDEQSSIHEPDEPSNTIEPTKFLEVVCGLSPEHQAAPAIKEEPLSLSEAKRPKQEQHGLSTSSPEFPMNRCTPGSIHSSGLTAHNVSIPAVPTEESESPVLHTENAILGLSSRNAVSPSQHTEDSYSQVASPKQTWNHDRRLFGESMEIDVTSDHKVAGVARLQGTSLDNCDLAPVLEVDRKRSVETQTMSRSQVYKLIAEGKLSKWVADGRKCASDEDDSGAEDHGQEKSQVPLKRVTTTKKGAEVSIVEDNSDASKYGHGESEEAGSSLRVASQRSRKRTRSNGSHSADGEDTSKETQSACVDKTLTESEGANADNDGACHEDKALENDDADIGTGGRDQEQKTRTGETKEQASKPKTAALRNWDNVPIEDRRRNGRATYMSFETVGDADFEYLCGLTREKFQVLYNNLGGDEVCLNKLECEREMDSATHVRGTNMSSQTRLFMTLFHLRRGLSERLLGILFGCSKAQVSRIITTLVPLCKDSQL